MKSYKQSREKEEPRLCFCVILTKKAKKVQKTVFFVTHDVDEALLLANRILVLGQRPSNVIYDVKIPEEMRASRETIFKNEDVMKLRNELIYQINKDVASHIE